MAKESPIKKKFNKMRAEVDRVLTKKEICDSSGNDILELILELI